MELGKKIKKLRLDKGITQEKLADYLNVSFQAVSKWEKELTSPDISLLPKLSTFFGITIDDLFTLNNDAHLERIENMLFTEKNLNSQDESYVKNYLIGLLEIEEKKGPAYRVLSKLNNHRAASYHDKALEYAKKALEIEPNDKENHTMLVEASKGVFMDWNYNNHHDLCNFYYEFCDKNPQYWRGYLYLLDHLIEDGRLVEATDTIKHLKRTNGGYLVYWYEGRIAKKDGNHEKAFRLFDQMVNSDTNNWLVWATRADENAKVGNYNQAITDNMKALSLQPKPRYIDAHECMAQIYEINKDYKNAIAMWEDAIFLLKNEWSITFGEPIDRPKREIRRLKEFI